MNTRVISDQRHFADHLELLVRQHECAKVDCARQSCWQRKYLHRRIYIELSSAWLARFNISGSKFMLLIGEKYVLYNIISFLRNKCRLYDQKKLILIFFLSPWKFVFDFVLKKTKFKFLFIRILATIHRGQRWSEWVDGKKGIHDGKNKWIGLWWKSRASSHDSLRIVLKRPQ